MVARFSAAGLGLLAFAITTTAGLFVGNPVETTLSRSIFALITFCFIGFFLGGAAQRVVTEHEKERSSVIRKRYHQDVAVKEDGEQGPLSAAGYAEAGENLTQTTARRRSRPVVPS